MGVENLIEPIDFSNFKKQQCGSTASSASNSACPTSKRKFDYYGPWTLASRIPIPPRERECETEYPPTEQELSMQGTAQSSAPINLNWKKAELTEYNSSRPSVGSAGGVSGGGAPGAPVTDGDRYLNVPTEYVADKTHKRDSTAVLTSMGRTLSSLTTYEICKTKTEFTEGSFTVNGPGGSQTFSTAAEMIAAHPNIVDDWTSDEKQKFEAAIDAADKANSNKTQTWQTSQDVVLDGLAVNFDPRPGINLSMKPIIGMDTTITQTAESTLDMSIQRKVHQGTVGGKGAVSTSGGTDTFGSPDYNYNNNVGDPSDPSRSLRYGLSIDLTMDLGIFDLGINPSYVKSVKGTSVGSIFFTICSDY